MNTKLLSKKFADVTPEEKEKAHKLRIIEKEGFIPPSLSNMLIVPSDPRTGCRSALWLSSTDELASSLNIGSVKVWLLKLLR